MEYGWWPWSGLHGSVESFKCAKKLLDDEAYLTLMLVAWPTTLRICCAGWSQMLEPGGNLSPFRLVGLACHS